MEMMENSETIANLTPRFQADDLVRVNETWIALDLDLLLRFFLWCLEILSSVMGFFSRFSCFIKQR